MIENLEKFEPFSRFCSRFISFQRGSYFVHVPLVVSSLLAVLFGAGLSRLLPLNYIQIGAGIFFIVIGIWLLISITRIA
ncbi:MAG: TMEM165/GDT1 family protein [Desulfobacteraceae bacterium]|nr:TMEM165/GDT1 family protein [Desulfobacteraceae bacterium]MBC2718888.1 TMEM165/GDT1 family protein [Desulfobacteraceae bacterium]